MYYYIFDIRQCKNKAQAERIKDYLAELGIGGEYVYPSQARTANELVKDALHRDFSTIVAIGNDSLISDVASELVGKHTALGIIPLNASDSINRIVNGQDWHSAAKNLRFRKIKETRLGQFENGSHFLTSTHLEITSSVNITLEFDDFIAQARAKRLIISVADGDKSGLLNVFMTAENPNQDGLLAKLKNYFDNPPFERSIKDSIFNVHRLRIFSQKKLHFVLNRQNIAETPQLITISPKFLRLIVARERLESESK